MGDQLNVASSPGDSLVPLRLGFDPDFAPLTYLSGARPAGRAVDIVRAACDRAGLALELVPVGLAARKAAAELELNGFACMAVTAARERFTFTLPYLTTEAALFFAVGHGGPLETSAVAGRYIVTTPRGGPLYALLLERASAQAAAGAVDAAATADVVPGTDYRECLERVLRGEADSAALNALVGRAMVAKFYPGRFSEVPAPLPPLGLAIALIGTAGAQRALVDRLNPALEAVLGSKGAR